MQNLPPSISQTYCNQVWAIVRQVPYGRVVTYGQIAQMLEPPEGIDSNDYKAFGPRWVGDAMAACPDDVPWQRVINGQGKISDRPGAMKQKRLLEDEGVIFVKNKLDLKTYQWRQTDQGDRAGGNTLTQGRLF